MPNHVYNTLEFTGDTRSLNRIMKKVSMPNLISKSKTEFDFYNLITPSDMESYRDGDNWYNWNIVNWGTKWNAYYVEVDDKIDSDHPFLGYSFTTAWSEPIGVILALAEYLVDQKLNVQMDWRYEEEQGWGGMMHYDLATGLSCTEQWDIPSCHQDHCDRDLECYCTESGSPVYDDCPEPEGEL